MKLKSRDSCRICGSKNLTSILNLGDQYFANYSPKSNDVVPFEEKIPLELVRCDKSLDPESCGLVQLRHTTPPNLMYDRYFYRSGINQTMTNNLITKGIRRLFLFENMGLFKKNVNIIF